ncbi:DUF6350 family protein [Homoserinimonas sp. OAct 916]|uniref:cell division protein PerM n=1 Tax=Homoserinimonas sp. OAct 916 TaxID=2211450 RepID=UPI000DBE4757|nr:DUF6350 family protein [Homoserinimonas sp. OAct 916]
MTAALLASLEAVIAAAVGIGIALVPLTVLWATHFDLMVDWAIFWRAAADTWLLGHGTDLMVALDPSTATALGLPEAGSAFAVTLAPLGFALVAVLFGLRAGTRGAASGHRTLALAVAIGTYALIAALVTWSANDPAVQVNAVQGIVLPALVYAVGVLAGAFVRNRQPAEQKDALSRLVRIQWERVPVVVRAMTRPVLAGGAAAAASIVALAAVAVAFSLVLNYATIIQLYESLQAGVLGGATLTGAQLLLLPNLVIWAAAWLIGPGFSIGVGSSVSPLGTQLGPVPALPILGALPEGQLALGYLGLLVPVLAGFLAGVLFRPAVVRALSGMASWRWQAGAGVGVGVVGGAIIGALAWFSAGSLGPGRLVEVGPHPWQVAGFAALEIGIGAAVGMLVGARARTDAVSGAAPGFGWADDETGTPLIAPPKAASDGADDDSANDTGDGTSSAPDGSSWLPVWQSAYQPADPPVSSSADDTDTQEITLPGDPATDEGSHARG